MPIFLSGGAFWAYAGLEIAVQNDYVRLKEAMLEAMVAAASDIGERETNRVRSWVRLGVWG